ncbi:ribosomal protein [Musa troglodytarum]|uniref:Ribosomal protein n=1 Tax=Musa troglodytarum TaxID=320322 RepID=A0A9E7HSJ1_9LILI|nr:ribosomal protein [Musa troglodytarum]
MTNPPGKKSNQNKRMLEQNQAPHRSRSEILSNNKLKEKDEFSGVIRQELTDSQKISPKEPPPLVLLLPDSQIEQAKRTGGSAFIGIADTDAGKGIEVLVLREETKATQRRRDTTSDGQRSCIKTPNGSIYTNPPSAVPFVCSHRLRRTVSVSLCVARKMPFKRYVEIGRVALVNYGKEYGRLVVIVDVIDQNRLAIASTKLVKHFGAMAITTSCNVPTPWALVDAPDMVRGQMNFKRLSLTDIKIDIPRVPKKKTLIGAMEAADVKNKWEKSSWGRKLIVQKRRASLNDFDRFKVMLAKIKRGGGIRQELAKLRKENAA